MAGDRRYNPIPQWWNKTVIEKGFTMGDDKPKGKLNLGDEGGTKGSMPKAKKPCRVARGKQNKDVSDQKMKRRRGGVSVKKKAKEGGFKNFHDVTKVKGGGGA